MGGVRKRKGEGQKEGRRSGEVISCGEAIFYPYLDKTFVLVGGGGVRWMILFFQSQLVIFVHGHCRLYKEVTMAAEQED